MYIELLSCFMHLAAGQTYISQVRARDAANQISELVTAAPVVFDTTPPIKVNVNGYSANIVKDGSFEDSPVSTSCKISPGSSWTINPPSCAYISKDIQAQDGHHILTLQGNVTQNVYAEENGKYQLMFYASTFISDKVLMSSNEGFVSVDGKTHVFMLYNKPNTQSVSWQLHKFLIDLRKGGHLLEVGTADGNSVLRVDNITLQMILYSDDTFDPDEAHVLTHAVFLHDWSSLHADWHFVDDESGIVDYQWAIGV